MLKDSRVEVWDVDDGERSCESGNNGPEQEPIVVNGFENGKRAGKSVIHVEQAAVKVLDLPGGNK